MKYPVFILVFLLQFLEANAAKDIIILPPLSEWEKAQVVIPDLSNTYMLDGDGNLINTNFYNITLTTNDSNEYIWKIKFQMREEIKYHASRNTKEYSYFLVDNTIKCFGVEQDTLISLTEVCGLETNSGYKIYIRKNSKKDFLSSATCTALDLMAKEYLSSQHYKRRLLITRRSNRIGYENWLLKNKNHISFFIGGNFSPGSSYRSYKATSLTQYPYEEYRYRSSSERNVYGNKMDLNGGLIQGRKHHYYLSIHYQTSGFRADSSQLINWKTGLANGGAYEDITYRFKQIGVGIGYKYIGYSYNYLLAPVFDISLYYSRVTRYQAYTIADSSLTSLSGSRNLKKSYIKPAQFGIQLGLGVAARFNYNWDVHVVPIIAYNINSVNDGRQLKAYLFHTGVQCGVNYRFLNHKK